MTKRILIASDLLMTKEVEQASNNRWMFDLLQRPIERATHIVPELWEPDQNRPDVFDRRKFFGKSNIILDDNATQFWFDYKDITSESKNYLSQFIGPDDILIGYEISRQTREVLSDLGVVYLDMWLHPVRFLDDVMFAFNSNNPNIKKRLYHYEVPEDQMYLNADRIKIQTYKGWRRKEADIPANSALFVGQMLNDKSVCSNGKMLNFLDYLPRMEQLEQEHSKIYYARHPYLRSGDEEILKYIKKHPKYEIADIPTYRLLSSDQLTRVIGVSSSVITEAKYFDKDAEFLFKPVLGYTDQADPMSYVSIMQSFVSPHFWSDIFRLCLRTYPCPEIVYENPKDKVRDMLGFYWSYADIDKTEYTRQRLNQVATKPRSATKPKPGKPAPRNTPSGYYNTETQNKEIGKLIKKHDMVSFDIFDTLIERVVERPGDIHPMMEARANHITEGKISDFLKARRACRDMALDRANGEEVLLRDRYLAMAKHYDIEPEKGIELYTLELAMELAACKPRKAGVDILAEAKKQGKKVILISDIYLDRAFILQLLEHCGISGWDRLYLSSEEGLLKQTGRLFDAVLSDIKEDPSKILHIGDNPKADIEMGKSRGLSTYHLTEKRLISDQGSPAVQAWTKISDHTARSLIKGLSAREYTRKTLQEFPGSVNSDPECLGYTIAGPMFWGFAKSIYEKTKDTGITDLYFLARDGDIVKKCYDIITHDNPDAPKSHYLLASRRSVSVARIQQCSHIHDNLKKNFAPCTLASLLMNRFGIKASEISSEAYTNAGYVDQNSIADWNRDQDKVITFFTSDEVKGKILQNSTIEREHLTKYYAQNGLGDADRNVAFVDIGHSGSLQAAITDMMNITSSTGFYFASKDDIDDVIGKNHRSIGFAADRINHKDANHPYQKHILMFELLFQNEDGSFLCFDTNSKDLKPTYIEMASEAPRIEFIKLVHAGIARFTHDFEEAATQLGVEPKLTGEEAVLAYTQLLKHPQKEDVLMFKDIGFENKYSSRDIRWIVATGKDDDAPSIWIEGAAALREKSEEREYGSSGFIPLSIVRPFVRKPRLKNKLNRDPDAFFADSKRPFVRRLGTMVN